MRREVEQLACFSSAPGVPWLFRGVPWPCPAVCRGVCRGVPGVFRGCAVVVKKKYPALGGGLGIFLGGGVVRLLWAFASAVTCASASAVTFLHACVVHPNARSGTRQGNGRPAGTGEGLV